MRHILYWYYELFGSTSGYFCPRKWGCLVGKLFYLQQNFEVVYINTPGNGVNLGTYMYANYFLNHANTLLYIIEQF